MYDNCRCQHTFLRERGRREERERERARERGGGEKRMKRMKRMKQGRWMRSVSSQCLDYALSGQTNPTSFRKPASSCRLLSWYEKLLQVDADRSRAISRSEDTIPAPGLAVPTGPEAFRRDAVVPRLIVFVESIPFSMSAAVAAVSRVLVLVLVLARTLAAAGAPAASIGLPSTPLVCNGNFTYFKCGSSPRINSCRIQGSNG
jgi:hypothetical protein